MGIMDKFKNFIGIPEDEYYDDEDVDFISSDNGRGDMREDPPSHSEKRGNKVVNIHATTQLQVVLVKPERFEDASAVADHLNDKRTVVLNLESTNKDVSRRLIDFLSGVAYANNGQIKRVANSTYIITPYNVDIMGDLLDELESSGVFFSWLWRIRRSRHSPRISVTSWRLPAKAIRRDSPDFSTRASLCWRADAYPPREAARSICFSAAIRVRSV